MPIWGRPTWAVGRSRPIDRYAGLTQGLLGFYNCDQSNSLAIGDATSNIDLPLSRFGSANPWGNSLGTGLLCNVVGAGAIATVPASLQVAPPITMAVAFRAIGTATVPVGSAAPIFAIEKDTGNVRVAAIEVNSTGNILTFLGSLNAFYTSAATLVAGTDHVVVITGTPTAATAYVDGAAVGSAAGASSLPWTSSSTIALGCALAAWSARFPNVLVYWAGWWGRALALGEIAAISGSPSSAYGVAYGPYPAEWLYAHAAAPPAYQPWIYGDQIEANGLG